MTIEGPIVVTLDARFEQRLSSNIRPTKSHGRVCFGHEPYTYTDCEDQSNRPKIWWSVEGFDEDGLCVLTSEKSYPLSWVGAYGERVDELTIENLPEIWHWLSEVFVWEAFDYRDDPLIARVGCEACEDPNYIRMWLWTTL